MGMVKPPDFTDRKRFLVYSCLVGVILLLGLVLVMGVIGGLFVVL